MRARPTESTATVYSIPHWYPGAGSAEDPEKGGVEG